MSPPRRCHRSAAAVEECHCDGPALPPHHGRPSTVSTTLPTLCGHHHTVPRSWATRPCCTGRRRRAARAAPLRRGSAWSPPHAHRARHRTMGHVGHTCLRIEPAVLGLRPKTAQHCAPEFFDFWLYFQKKTHKVLKCVANTIWPRKI
jgi:hypothetical protein